MAGNSGGASTSASSLMQEMRTALLKNSSRILASEAEALLHHTFAKDWDHHVVRPTPLQDHVVVEEHDGHHNHFNAVDNGMLPSNPFLAPMNPTTHGIVPPLNHDFNEPCGQDFDFLLSENTLDWVSSLYNSLPTNEMFGDDGDSRMMFDHQLLPGEMDFLGLNGTMNGNGDDVWDIDGGKLPDNDEILVDAECNLVEQVEGINLNGTALPAPLTCAQCGFVASNRKQLWRHGKRENHTTRSAIKPPPSQPKPPKDRVDHQCDLCLYTSKSRFNVVRHYQRVHVNQKSTSCDTCGKQFKDVDTLKTHIRYTHDNTRRHQCPNCDKLFVSSSDLLRHRKIVHDKARDYVCQKCGKRFQTSTNAKRHYLEVCTNNNAETMPTAVNASITNFMDAQQFVLPPGVVVTNYLPMPTDVQY